MYPVYQTIEELLNPAVLTKISGEAISQVKWSSVYPVRSESGSTFHLVSTNWDTGPRFLLKHISIDSNWIMRATNDTSCREAQIWLTGLLDELPHGVEHPYLAVAYDGGEFMVLMRDVTNYLIETASLPIGDHELILKSMAEFHAQFWKRRFDTRNYRALCRLEQLYSSFSPKQNSLRQSNQTPWPWNRLFLWLQNDVAIEIERLLLDPTRLSVVLKRFPTTLLHGDWRLANLAIKREQSEILIVFDWQLATIGPAAVDLAWYIGSSSRWFPVSKDEAVYVYETTLRDNLKHRFSDEWWKPQLALAFLGGFLRIGSRLISAPETERKKNLAADHSPELEWWIQKIRDGLNVLHEYENEAV